MSDASNDHSSNQDETESLAVHILALLSQVTERFDSDENEAWQWFAQHSHNLLIVELLRDSTTTTLRVLDAIGRSEPVNGITISESMFPSSHDWERWYGPRGFLATEGPTMMRSLGELLAEG